MRNLPTPPEKKPIQAKLVRVILTKQEFERAIAKGHMARHKTIKHLSEVNLGPMRLGDRYYS
jgi:hypothetical protein